MAKMGMMQGSSITISGLEELRVALRELPLNIQQRVLSGAVAKGSRVVLKKAKALVLKDTGLLQRSLRSTRGVRRQSEPSSFVTIRRLSKAKIAAYRKATGKKAATNPLDPFYWSILEFGKSNRTAHPFIRPAFEATKEDAAKTIGEALDIGIQKEAKKLAWSSGRK